MTNQDQMELGFDCSRKSERIVRKPVQPTRAQWWFRQMRLVVDRALDWHPTSPGRPEQVWLPGTQRVVRV